MTVSDRSIYCKENIRPNRAFSLSRPKCCLSYLMVHGPSVSKTDTASTDEFVSVSVELWSLKGEWVGCVIVLALMMNDGVNGDRYGSESLTQAQK